MIDCSPKMTALEIFTEVEPVVSIPRSTLWERLCLVCKGRAFFSNHKAGRLRFEPRGRTVRTIVSEVVAHHKASLSA